jgi:hypothetical protein
MGGAPGQERLPLPGRPSAWCSWNDNPKPFVWTKTAGEILDNLTSYLQRTNDSGH